MVDMFSAGPEALRRSPLAHLHGSMEAATITGERAVSLHEWPFVPMVSVRVEPDSAAYARTGAVLGADLPRTCGPVAQSDSHDVLWLGPDEWLVLATHGDSGSLVAALRAALDTAPGSIVDVSANRTIVELRGPSARMVLEKGCSLDLHPRAFGPRTAASTALGPVPVVLWQVDEDYYRLLPRSSYADYLARWLIDAMREFAGPEIP